MQKNILLVSIFSFLTIAASVATAATSAYEGAARPLSEVAIVKCGISLGLRAIDGNERYQGAPLKCEFAVLPGRHELKVRVEEGMGDARAIHAAEHVIAFEVKAGHSYWIMARQSETTGDLPWELVVSDVAGTGGFVFTRRIKE